VESLLTCVTTAVHDHVRVMLGARARLGAQWTWLVLRLTFPQHDQASGSLVTASANAPFCGPSSTALAAGRWGHRWCQSLLALQYLLMSHKLTQHVLALIPLLIQSLMNKQEFLVCNHWLDGGMYLFSLGCFLFNNFCQSSVWCHHKQN